MKTGTGLTKWIPRLGPEPDPLAFYIDLDRLIMAKPAPAGSDPLVVMSLAYHYRTTLADVEPILVRHSGMVAGGRAYYTITDGKHRFMASMIAGRERILAKVER